MAPDEQVLDNRHLREDPQKLKGSRETKTGYLVRFAVGDVFTAKSNKAAGVGRIDARHRLNKVGFAGLVVFMNPALVDWTDPREVAGNLFLLLAAICWAAGSCLYGRRLWRSSFWAQTFWQLAVGTVTVVVPTVVFEPNWSVHWTPGFSEILIYNCVVTTALGYFLWNKVLAVMSPAVAGQVLTLTPISGFLLSTLIFGGAITLDIVAGIVLIALGLVMTLRP
jgi:drug/metabolite transporter (DMT)-like permease